MTEIGWFEPDALPAELAFPNGERALAEWRVWRAAQICNGFVTKT